MCEPSATPQDVVVSSDLRVTFADCRRAGYCSRGIRAFLSRHGLSFKTLLICGYSVDAIEATGDEMALRVIRQIRAR